MTETTTTAKFTVETIAADGLTWVVRIVETWAEAMEAARVAALTIKVVDATGFTVGVRDNDTATWLFAGTFDDVKDELTRLADVAKFEAAK